MRGRTTRRGAAAIAAIVAFGVVLTGCSGDSDVVELPEQASAELPADMTEQIDAAATRAMQASGATGGIVGVWAPWGGEYVTGVGSTAAEGGEDVTADMTFRIGDVTRAMTCDVLYGLAADGRLEVTDPVTQHVQNVAGLEEITLQQLCDGTSGIGSSEGKLLSNWLRTPEREWDPRELAAQGLIAVGGTPGAKFRESDAGYLLLGEALRKATGESPADLLDEYVAEPYALGSTFLPSPAAATPGTNYLPGYRSNNNDIENGCEAPAEFSKVSSSIGYTDSGVVSTIEDLGRYAQLLALGAADDDQGRFDHPLPVYPDGASWYQYGGGVYQAGPLIGQEGSTLGYATSVWADPSSGLTVAVVLNNSRSDSAAAKVGRQIAAIASRAPAADGFEQPEIGLPWSADGYDKQIAADAICPIDE